MKQKTIIFSVLLGTVSITLTAKPLPVVQDLYSQKVETPLASAPEKSAVKNQNSFQPMAPVSMGELIDKITILQIKLKKIRDPEKIENICFEMRALSETMQMYLIPSNELNELTKKLRDVNQKLWEIEDAIRAKEAEKKFDKEFIELARSVYFTNDERGQLKREINELTGSRVVEEKQYRKYQ